MKKSSKIILIFLIMFVLFFVIVVMMFLFTLCPPKGPWPTPPWCKQYSPVFYEIDVKADKLSQIKGVQMSDTWGRNYNFMMEGVTWKNISDSFDRVKELGAQEVYVHDMHQVKYKGEKNFRSTDYEIVGGTFWDDLRDEEIKQKHLNKLAEEAHSKGLKIVYANNLSFVNIGKYVSSDNIVADVGSDFFNFNQVHTEEWIKDFFKKWEQRMILKAEQLNEAGFDIMSITPTWMGPTFKQNEELANELWIQLIRTIKEEFNGNINVIIPFYGLAYEEPDNREMENTAYYDYYKEADIVQINFFGLHEKYASKGTSVEDIKKAYDKFLDEIEKRAEEKDVKFSIKFSAFSAENAVNLGPNGEMIEYHDIKNPALSKIKTDYEHQADQYQAFFESVKDREKIERIIIGGFWWDDALDPEVKVKISLSPSPRNKPAEALIKAWFNF
jgi:hypothetical protein